MKGRGELPRARGLTRYYYSDFVGLAAGSALKLSRHPWAFRNVHVKPKVFSSFLPARRQLLQLITLSFSLFETLQILRSHGSRGFHFSFELCIQICCRKIISVGVFATLITATFFSFVLSYISDDSLQAIAVKNLTHTSSFLGMMGKTEMCDSPQGPFKSFITTCDSRNSYACFSYHLLVIFVCRFLTAGASVIHQRPQILLLSSLSSYFHLYRR